MSVLIADISLTFNKTLNELKQTITIHRSSKKVLSRRKFQRENQCRRNKQTKIEE